MPSRLPKLMRALLQQGITPKKLALSVALGITLGIFPVLGSTTLLCAAAGLLLGLNQPALQGVNYIAYPLQLGLLIPFFRFGEWLFHSPRLAISREGVQALVRSGMLHTIHVLRDTTLHAIVAWGLVAPVIVAGVYVTVLPLFRRLVQVE
jgi:uncharacterized protein (DUF2062 family)